MDLQNGQIIIIKFDTFENVKNRLLKKYNAKDIETNDCSVFGIPRCEYRQLYEGREYKISKINSKVFGGPSFFVQDDPKGYIFDEAFVARNSTNEDNGQKMERQLRVKYFLGSTIEEIEEQELEFLKINNMCPGNFVYENLYKNGSVYQKVLYYAELTERKE